VPKKYYISLVAFENGVYTISVRKRGKNLMADKKEIKRSEEAQKLIDTLKAQTEPKTLAELSEIAGVDFKTGHLASGRKAGLIRVAGTKVIQVTVNKKVNTYEYVADPAKAD
jgi:hypothetical protein